MNIFTAYLLTKLDWSWSRRVYSTTITPKSGKHEFKNLDRHDRVSYGPPAAQNMYQLIKLHSHKKILAKIFLRNET